MSEKEKLECTKSLRHIANIVRASDLSITEKEMVYDTILHLLDEILCL